MDIYDLLRVLPLASALTWFILAALQVYRDRIHTWTETFFLLSCIFAGLYATWDFLFFTAGDSNFATFAGRMSFSSAIVTSLFLLLFTLVYIDRMRRVYWSFGILTVAVLILFWSFGLESVNQLSGGLWIPVFNETVLLIVFTLTIFLGLGTNGVLGALRSQIPPPFSTLLLVVAGATIYTLYPGSRQRIAEAVRRFQARRYSIKASFLTFEDGTLIGAKAREGETAIDQDLFGATLDVIQNFMRTSFPILRGKALSSITHGNYTLVVERGRHTYLTVVLEGEESDQLRRQMRDLLLDFEAKNRQALLAWRGMPEEAKGTEQMLTSLLAEAPLL